MSDPPKRRRRDPASNVTDVFDQIRERMREDEAHGGADLPVIREDSLLCSNSAAGSCQVIGPDNANEIITSLHWTETFAEGLAFADQRTAPKNHVPFTRTRLRHVLNTLNYFMALHPELQKLSVRADITTLALALDSLNVGVVHPLLATQGTNKLPDTKLDQQFRGYVVSFVTLLTLADVSRSEAFKEVAAHLTAAGFMAPRPTDAHSPTAFKAETVRRYFQRAQPEAEERARAKDENADRAKVLGQADSQIVFDFINRFVMNAVHVDNEAMPPSKSYVRQVIEKTLRSPDFRALFAHKRRCA